MDSTRVRILAISILWLWSLAPLAFTHDLYLMPQKWVTESGALLKIHFENGDLFPAGGHPVAPARLRNTRLISKAGTTPFEGITAGKTRTEASVRIPGAGLVTLTAETLPNFIELSAPKFQSYLKKEHLTHVQKWRKANGEAAKPGRERYSKYVKSMVRAGASDGHLAAAGLTVEFAAFADPYNLAPGGTLPVQLLFRGQPADGVAVEGAWLERGKTVYRTIGRTGARGRIDVPIRASGPHRLHAIIMERCKDPKAADWESFWATLTFEIPASK
ncbi:MAG: DUF4198 domain-containing protein [Bryobacterales bacterium]|nr:DUF4198 domain-containing protein [Bryobacterales bacterium]